MDQETIDNINRAAANLSIGSTSGTTVNNTPAEAGEIDVNKAAADRLAALELQRINAEAKAKAELEAKAKAEENAKIAAALRDKMIDRNIRALIKQSREIITTRKKDLVLLNKKITELDYLNSYASYYENKSKPQDHYVYFGTIYNRYRSQILVNDDAWILESKKPIVIHFGEGIKELEEKTKTFKIMFTDIYKMALELKDIATKSMEGLDDKQIDTDSLRCDILKIYIFRIFYYLNDETDRNILGPIINKMEESLSLETRTHTVKVEQTSDLGGIFDMAKGIMKNMGMAIPDDIKAPSSGDMKTVVQNVFNNPNTQNTMKGIFTTLQNNKEPQDIGSALNSIVKNITDPTTMSVLRDTVSQSAEQLHKDK